MFKSFSEPLQEVDAIYMTKNYPKMAYLLLNPENKRTSKGVILPASGKLKAIADFDGLTKLFNTANKESKKGQQVHLSTMTLDNTLEVLEQ